MFAIQFLNAVGDLLDLVPVLRSRRFSLSDLFSKPTMGHCSVLIKVRSSLHFLCNTLYSVLMFKFNVCQFFQVIHL